MIVVRSLDELSKEQNSIVTVGTFDGVHRAHQEIIREVVERSSRRHYRSAIVTFDPHPKEVVQTAKGPVALLTTMDERIGLMEELGVGVLFIINFTQAFSLLSSRQFYERYLVNGVGVSEVIVGYDHMFGRNRQGTLDELIKMGKELDFSVFGLPAYSVGGEVVSSTHIRRALAEGNIAVANTFLGREYRLDGTVVKGDGRGKSIGFPTANIAPGADKKVVPGNGVYVVKVQLEGNELFGMLNIGVRPTVTQDGAQTVEVHIFDFSDDLYGKSLRVMFMHRLRDEKKFASLDALIQQLERDKAESLKLISEYKR